MSDPYRQQSITLEQHERVVAELRSQLQTKQRELDAAQETAFRLEGAKAVLYEGVEWLKYQEWWESKHNSGRTIDAGLFLIWLLRATNLSSDGKSFNVEAGRNAR